MAVTITPQSGTLGAGAKSPAYGGGGRPLTFRLYDITLDSSFASGGESISACFDDFTEVVAAFVNQNDDTLDDVRYFVIDRTNKKIQALKTLASGANVEADGDLSNVHLDVLLIGY